MFQGVVGRRWFGWSVSAGCGLLVGRRGLFFFRREEMRGGFGGIVLNKLYPGVSSATCGHNWSEVQVRQQIVEDEPFSSG